MMLFYFGSPEVFLHFAMFSESHENPVLGMALARRLYNRVLEPLVGVAPGLVCVLKWGHFSRHLCMCYKMGMYIFMINC